MKMSIFFITLVYAGFISYMLRSPNVNTCALPSYGSLWLFLISAIVLMIGVIMPDAWLLPCLLIGCSLELFAVAILSDAMRKLGEQA